MTNWRALTIDPMSPPVGREGLTVGLPVPVHVQAFSDAAELEADPLWQAAPITKKARPMLMARPFRGTRISPILTEGGDALILHYAAPDAAFGTGTIVSVSPRREIMRRQDRILIVWANRAEVIHHGRSVGFAKRRAVDEPAKDLLAQMYSDADQAQEVRNWVAVERVRAALGRLIGSESLLQGAVEEFNGMASNAPTYDFVADRVMACIGHMEVDREMLGKICDHIAIEPGMPDDVAVEILRRRLEVMTPDVWCGLAAAAGAGSFQPVWVEEHVNMIMGASDESRLDERVRRAVEMVDAYRGHANTGNVAEAY
jgi:hypothetical protein